MGGGGGGGGGHRWIAWHGYYSLHVLLKGNYCSPHQPLPTLTLDMPAGSLPLPMNRRKDEDEMARGDGEIGKREGQEGRGEEGGEGRGREGRGGKGKGKGREGREGEGRGGKGKGGEGRGREGREGEGRGGKGKGGKLPKELLR